MSEEFERGCKAFRFSSRLRTIMNLVIKMSISSRQSCRSQASNDACDVTHSITMKIRATCINWQKVVVRESGHDWLLSLAWSFILRKSYSSRAASHPSNMQCNHWPRWSWPSEGDFLLAPTILRICFQTSLFEVLMVVMSWRFATNWSRPHWSPSFSSDYDGGEFAFSICLRWLARRVEFHSSCETLGKQPCSLSAVIRYVSITISRQQHVSIIYVGNNCWKVSKYLMA